MDRYKTFIKSNRFLFLWLIAVSLNIITFLLVFTKSGLKGPNVALRYNIQAGVLWYGEGRNLFSIPILGLIFNSLNFYLFKKLSANQRFLTYTAVLAAILVQLIFLLSIALIALVN